MTWGRSGVVPETDQESLGPVEADAGSISDEMLLSVSQDFHHCCFSENLTLLLSQIHHMHRQSVFVHGSLRWEPSRSMAAECHRGAGAAALSGSVLRPSSWSNPGAGCAFGYWGDIGISRTNRCIAEEVKLGRLMLPRRPGGQPLRRNLIDTTSRAIFHSLIDIVDTSRSRRQVAALGSNWSEVAGWSFRRWWVSAPERKSRSE